MNWTPLQRNLSIPARPPGFWTFVLENVPAGLLRFSASGKWSYSGLGVCGPDGDARSLLLRAGLQLSSAPVGALIGKIGGSSAGWRDGTVFLVGRDCVYSIAKDVNGPLYLSINDEYTGMDNNDQHVVVDILVDMSAPADAAAAPTAQGEEDGTARAPGRRRDAMIADRAPSSELDPFGRD